MPSLLRSAGSLSPEGLKQLLAAAKRIQQKERGKE